MPKIAAVCSSNCYNGGICTAPNTCLCAPGWTGPTCAIGRLRVKLFLIDSVTCILYKKYSHKTVY